MNELLIEAQSLKAWDGLIVDTRMPQRYAAGHLPGAVNLPLVSIRQQQGPVTLVADAGDFAQRAGAAGIGQDTPLVVYSERGQPDAGYVMWALHYHGHAGVRLLDGGLEAWVSQGNALVEEIPSVGNKPFNAVLAPEKRVDRDWMLAHLDDEGVCLLDNRTYEEYTGEDVLARQGGHIPGACWLPWEALLQPDLSLRPKTQLRYIFSQAGLRPDHTAVVHCQTGNRSGLVYVGLQLIGHTDVRMYDASWSQWGNELNLPIEIGERRESCIPNSSI